MRVLITNDDGIDAPGLAALAAAVAARHPDVVVAAPVGEASGASAALYAVADNGQLRLHRRELAAAPGVSAYAVDASPAYIALLGGLGTFGAPPDVVLSGINRGANAGHAVLYSGTVGAAFSGARGGARGLAVSLDILGPAVDPRDLGDATTGGARLDAAHAVDDATRQWAPAAEHAVALLPRLAALPPGTVLNLNVPDRPAIAGVRWAELADFGQVQMSIAEAGEGFVRTTVEETTSAPVPGTDLALLGAGYATVTALHPAATLPPPFPLP
ncbi:5'/3'-nucleotidase SurE [Pilimelia anulata]|uniref:5'-nucleotidase n=1 Tax=Pilimelia anulata TaxID=53371 RepID=A0A8J3FFM6_9ACTN|nr:5'/3'-nucleotidase SurE [Pilimelia anulata]GGK05560.1 5'/3'-nucleotidase SurE [Pilimelia anulata]